MANVGVFSILAAQKARLVIAVDASAFNAKLVAANAVLNGLDNVEVHPVAAAAAVGVATIDLGNSTNHTVQRGRNITLETIDQLEIVAAMPLDLIVDGRKIDVFKIDIEGREFAALQGANRILAERPLIFIEYSHDFAMNGCGVSGAELLRLFFARGYTATILHRDMRREPVGQDQKAIDERWREYVSRSITHLDLMMTPTD